MPIKPENRARYPANWPEVRAAILIRSEGRCEHRDDRMSRCTARQYEVGRWVTVDKWRLPVGFERLQQQVPAWRPIGEPHASYGAARQAAAEAYYDAAGEGPKPIVIVLTVAHLDHQPENCDPENLRALCQRHHLAHDHDHHRANAQATRRAKSGTPDLFA